MGKVKCPECNGCMEYLWIKNKRYLFCPFCMEYYEGFAENVTKADNPYAKELEEAKKNVGDA